MRRTNNQPFQEVLKFLASKKEPIDFVLGDNNFLELRRIHFFGGESGIEDSHADTFVSLPVEILGNIT